MGEFDGDRWHNNAQTLSSQTLLESKWLTLSRHTVYPNIESRNTIDDWLWIDTKSQINILVSVITNDNTEKFLVFEQRFYGLNNPSYAIVGGHIEKTDKNPLMAAKRELFEELGMIVDDENNWIQFGGFRTDVNRGLGFCYMFFARQATFKDKNKHNVYLNQMLNDKQLTIDNSEKLNVKLLTLNQLKDYFQNGLFQEVKWSNTVGLTIMHLLNE